MIEDVPQEQIASVPGVSPEAVEVPADGHDDPPETPEEADRREREEALRREEEARARLRREAEERQARRIAASRRRLRVMLPFLLVLVFLVYAFTTNFIPSESMLPALRPGDHVLTMRAWLAYPRGAMPRTGDIVVFVEPPNLSDGDEQPDQGTRSKLFLFRSEGKPLLIKRVVALPGQTVQVWDDQVYVNGTVQRPTHQVLSDTPWGFRDTRYGTWRPLRLGKDELFVMGDNHANSEDSRYYGPIKRSTIVGRFVTVLWNEGDSGPNERRARSGR